MNPPRGTRIGIMTAAVLILGLAAGCSGMSDSSSASSSAASSAAATGAGEMSAGVAAVAPAPEGEAAAPASAVDNRQIVRTADLQIRLPIDGALTGDDYDAAQRDAIDAAVGSARSQALGSGGFVADLQQNPGSASLVIRIPADRYDSFRDAATQLGEVTNSTESAADVTDEYVDIASRIASMQVSIDRMRTLLSQASAVADIITVESELSRREADLESLQGRQAVLTDQVSLGTVSITFSTSRDSIAITDDTPDRSGFLGGLADGWDGLTGFLGGVAVVAGTLLPFLPLIAVVVLVGWLIRRRIRARTTPTAVGSAPERPTVA